MECVYSQVFGYFTCCCKQCFVDYLTKGSEVTPSHDPLCLTVTQAPGAEPQPQTFTEKAAAAGAQAVATAERSGRYGSCGLCGHYMTRVEHDDQDRWTQTRGFEEDPGLDKHACWWHHGEWFFC